MATGSSVNKEETTGWFYQLRREQLVECMTELGLNTDGSVEELRLKMRTYLSNEHTPEESNRISQIRNKYISTKPTSNTMTPEFQPSVTSVPVQNPIYVQHYQPDYTGAQSPLGQGGMLPISPGMGDAFESNHKRTIMETVRKWGITYNGGSDPFSFLERLEELSATYGLHMDFLPATMPHFLREQALTWFRNNNQQWKTWQSFKADLLNFFLPPRYQEQIEDEIRARLQRPNELYRDYVLELQAKMRHTTMSEGEKLSRIYRNSLPEYLRYIKRTDFQNLNQLMQLAGDYESIPTTPQPAPRRSQEVYQQQTDQQPPLMIMNPRMACRRCGQMGHIARTCQNQQRIFCWQCGRQGVRTIECCRPTEPGNGRGARAQQGSAGPRRQTPHNPNQS